MRQTLAVLLFTAFLVGCTVPETGHRQLVEVSYTCADGKCNSVMAMYSTPTPVPTNTLVPTATPGPTSTPYPFTTGRLRLEADWDPFLGPDTYIEWTIVSAPGPVHLTVNRRDVSLVMYSPGDYILRGAWTYSNTLYTTSPYTITVNP